MLEKYPKLQFVSVLCNFVAFSKNHLYLVMLIINCTSWRVIHLYNLDGNSRLHIVEDIAKQKLLKSSETILKLVK